ncbi:hypothetical protein, partial [Janthinobacterium sp.]|uniref:hypothetical protein n=1 Tax=Janthinobacterium sp. TaxID=1871054 RepID=UPI00293D803D
MPQQDFHEGEYKNNLRHGQGRYQWSDGRQYMGNYEDDSRHGYGVFLYPNGERYKGYVNVICMLVASATKLQRSSNCRFFEKGQRSGQGRFDFIEDKIEGNGKTMGYYEGAWKAGKYHGEGRVVWGSTGCSYEGEWLNGMMHGYGVKRDDRSGKILQEGFWARGKFHEAAAVDDAVIEDRCNELGDATARQDATRG